MAPNKAALLLIFSAFAGISKIHADAQSGLNVEEFKKTPSALRQRSHTFVQSPDTFSMQKLRVSAIVYSRDRQAALILGQIVKVGDKVGNSEVLEIKPKSVTLRNENGVFRISIDRPTSGVKP